jgi:pimeloyl-ACP methyl ester carboxylesterase
VADNSACYGLAAVRVGSSDHSVVVLHGIRQTRDALYEFASWIADTLADSSVYVYGYNHTEALEVNGRRLLDTIIRDIPSGRVDLVGYSMGGLVARLAASEPEAKRLNTIVTVATPNRGAISNAELTMLGQVGRRLFERISPMAPRTRGVTDLTRVMTIMKQRRDALELAGCFPRATVRRYASIPGLFYNDDRDESELGPSIQMAGLRATILLIGFKMKLFDINKAHDGIVTEASNDVTAPRSFQFSELDLVLPGENGEKALCHAIAAQCVDQDHITIIREQRVAELVAALVATDDWRALKANYPTLAPSIRIKLADAM